MSCFGLDWEDISNTWDNVWWTRYMSDFQLSARHLEMWHNMCIHICRSDVQWGTLELSWAVGNSERHLLSSFITAIIVFLCRPFMSITSRSVSKKRSNYINVRIDHVYLFVFTGWSLSSLSTPLQVSVYRLSWIFR